MREVVRTTTLSSRWKTLWTTTPYLNFEDFKVEIDADRVRNFVNRALVLWRGTSIRKFKIDFGVHLSKSIYTDIDFWLLFAMKYEVKVLNVWLDYVGGNIDCCVGSKKGIREEMYWAPQCLYSCSSLQELNLQGCNLHIPHENVHWNQLEYLKIIGYEVSPDLIKRVLCGSPQLEVLILALVENHENLSIDSTSLINLYINKYLFFRYDQSYVDTELRICTPYLETLELTGVPYSKCLINDVPFLTDAYNSFDGLNYCSHHMFSGNGFVGETLKQILPSIQC